MVVGFFLKPWGFVSGVSFFGSDLLCLFTLYFLLGAISCCPLYLFCCNFFRCDCEKTSKKGCRFHQG